MNSFGILAVYWPSLLQGFITTIALTTISFSIALIEGVILGLVAAEVHPVSYLVRGGFWIACSVPLIVALYWAHYPLQEVLSVVWPPFWVAVGVLSQLASFYISSSVLHAIWRLPMEIRELVSASSLSVGTATRRIYLPIVSARIMPEILTVLIWILHGTLFASLISVQESFRVAQQINSVVHAPIAVYTALAIVFASISLPILVLVEHLRKLLFLRGMLY